MPFKRTDNYRNLELTSLIDVVFLLLIFFLVSFAFSLAGDAEVSESKVYSEIELPKASTQLPVIKNDILENLLIQIVPDSTQPQVTRRVYILWPSYDDTTKISRLAAYSKAFQDSSFAVFPADFLFLSKEEFYQTASCTLITNSIQRYIQKEKIYHRNSRPVIEVRAEQNTEFKIINFIMDHCSSYQDVVPQIIIRTVL